MADKKYLSQFISKLPFHIVISLFLCFPSWGIIQHRPIGSPERHEIAGGWTLGDPFVDDDKVILTPNQKNGNPSPNPVAGKRAYFLNYSLYFPEVTALLPKPWNKIGAPGLSLGARLFQKGGELCIEQEQQSLFTHLGLKARFSYFEKVIPFVEYGLGWLGCVQNLKLDKDKPFKYTPTSTTMKTYAAIGLNLSFKILDRKSIYSLDQDYGFNDMGIHGQCRWYHGTMNEKKTSVFMCEAGLSLLF